MEQTISFDTYKNIFDTYADRYDKNDGRVELKIVHTNAVVVIMKKICEMRRLPEHTRDLALLCAQFHDIGRFEQLRQYDTFLDHRSVNHALLSCQVLEENKILDALPKKDRQKILTAIANHNKLKIDPSVTAKAARTAFKDGIPEGPDPDALECLELCKLIRDADKCDIFRVFAVDDMMDVVGATEEEISHETITPAVLQAIREHRCIDKVIRKTYLDHWISYLGYFFDLNYTESMKIAREQGYYRMPFDRTDFKDAATKEQIHEVLCILEDYIDHFDGEPETAAGTIGSSETAALDHTIPSTLRHFFKEHPSAALAFSGGTDSAYLLYAAKACGCHVRAYYVSTPFQPAFELEDARRLANELHADMAVLPFNVLNVEIVRKNPPDRCYHCKKVIFNSILEAAAKDGYTEIMDGTNASDDAGDRPGMRALREMKILSPLRLCGITKKALREYSRNAGLFTWDKPAYACLATRLPSGLEIREDILKKAELAEIRLAEMGFVDFRVRILPLPSSSSDTGNRSFAARIQVTENQLSLLMKNRRAILEALSGEFSDILLDLHARTASV